DEELDELGAALGALADDATDASGDSAAAAADDDPAELARAAVREELGDVLFALVNVGRKLRVDPEAALAGTNRKFRRRFERIEAHFRARGEALPDVDLAAMDAVWNAVKDEER
ncbi:MAG: MazG nucleotide pyrophosphohydrolase domain-containing protein, partial [Acidobacteriota bacterium]